MFRNADAYTYVGIHNTRPVNIQWRAGKQQCAFYCPLHFQLDYSSSRKSRSLYRRCLKLSLDWAVHRYIWRGQAVYIRSLFDANKNVREPRQQRVSIPGPFNPSRLITSQALFQETEELLEKWKHPDPYRPPTAPGGTASKASCSAFVLNLLRV